MVEDFYTTDERGRQHLQKTRITIGGKEVKLRFTQKIWFRMEDEICIMDDLYSMMHGKGRFRKDKIPALVELMTEGEITADEFLKECEPADTRAIIDEIQSVIAKAMTMRERKDNDDRVHDATLEEIEKKEHRAD